MGPRVKFLSGEQGIAEAAAMLRDGMLVAFGTETVYGLGGDATNAQAVARIFTAKGRPQFNPLICHYASGTDAFADVIPNAAAQHLAAQFWPGPLTLVLPRRAGSAVQLLAGAGLDTLAVRVPAAPPARALLAQTGRPIAAPSANRSGSVSPTDATHVVAELAGRIDAVIDFGPCIVGLESTVLDLSGERPVLLRPGGIPAAAIIAAIGPITHSDASTALRAPGMLRSHYAPSLPVRLGATSAAPDEALLAFGRVELPSPVMWNLSETADVTEAAARLFAGLRYLDSAGRTAGLRGIAAMPVPETGLGIAVNDRLRRAAAPREG